MTPEEQSFFVAEEVCLFFSLQIRYCLLTQVDEKEQENDDLIGEEQTEIQQLLMQKIDADAFVKEKALEYELAKLNAVRCTAIYNAAHLKCVIRKRKASNQQ